MNARPKNDGREVSGRRALLAVLSLILLLAAGIILQAVFAAPTGHPRRTRLGRCGAAGPTGLG